MTMASTTYACGFTAICCALAVACAPSVPRILPNPVSAETDSLARTPCEATIRDEAVAGRRVYRESEVDQKPELIFEHRGPKFPNEPQPGTDVRVEFVVDPSGRADMSTFRPLYPVPADFLESVMDFMPTAKFKVGLLAGRAVAVCALQTFQFRMVTGPTVYR
jgi:hypothetical protein